MTNILKVFACKALFIISVVLSAHLYANEAWFDTITGPAALTSQQGISLVTGLRSGLLKQTKSSELVKLAPEDNTPRVLFITLGDGAFPSRIYYAAGSSFRNALENLLAIIAKREPEYVEAIKGELNGQIENAKAEKRILTPKVYEKLKNPAFWTSMRLDVVQAALPQKNYVIASSQLLLSSAVGIAFDAVASFAFTPEQLTGRCLMTAERQLSIPNISNIIAETTNWSAMRLWTQMSMVSTGFNVTLFECDSYYADETGAWRLFRNTAVPTEAAPITAASLSSSSQHLAKVLQEQITAKGVFQVPFIEWVASRTDGKHTMFDQAQLVMALSQAAALPELSRSDRKQFQSAARKAVQQLLRALRHFDPNEGRSSADPNKRIKRRPAKQREFAAIVEYENFNHASRYEMEVPKRIIDLRTNALAYLVFADAATWSDTDTVSKQCKQKLPQMFRYLLQQIFADGRYTAECRYPEITPILDAAKPSPLMAAETSSLVAMAIRTHLQNHPQDATQELRDFMNAWDKMLLDDWGATPNPKSEPLTPWLPIYFALEDVAQSPQLLAKLTKLALAAANDLEDKPMLPDMFGAPADIPSMTYAAERAWIIAVVAEKLRRAGFNNDAAGLLRDAWPLYNFASQAQMTAPTAAALPTPYRYLGFYRDNLADFGFTLNGQTTQLLAQVALAQAMANLKISALSPAPSVQKAYTECWKQLEKRPLCLSPELVQRGAAPGAENTRARAGQFSQATVKTFKYEGTYKAPPPSERTSFTGRVLERKK